MPVRKSIEQMFEEQRPLPGNKCRAKRCGGNVVAEVIGLFKGQYHYGTPACEKCGRTYLQADKRTVGKVGMEEFNEGLRRPMTI